MRRSLCFCLCFLFILTFSACGEFVPPEPVKNFSAVADVLYEDMQIVCEISANGQDNIHIAVTYPDTLRDFSYLWSNGMFKIGYRELYCENLVSPLPDTSFAAELGNFLNGLHLSDSYSFSKQTEKGCQFIYGDNQAVFTTETNSGRIISIEFPNMKVELRDFKTCL